MTHALSKLVSTDNSRFSRIAVMSSSVALGYWIYLIVRQRPKGALSDRKVLFLDKKASEKKAKKIDLNDTFRQLKIILSSIMRFQDVVLAAGVSLGLVLRTLLDLWNIQVTTKVEGAIITGDLEQLKQTLISFALTMPTLAFVNNSIKFFTDKLSLQLRYNLSRSLYESYMSEKTFYHLSQNSEFQNVDQLLTSDVDKFCSSIVEVYNNLSKPVLDIVLLVHRMSASYTGPQTPALMIGWLAFVGTVLTQARRPLSGYIIRETQSEGQLRFVLSRLIQNSEEVAFYKGNEKEKHTLMSALDILRDSLGDSILFRFKIGLMDNIVGRYLSTVVGYLALALPFFSARYAGSTNESRLTQYYVAGRMMVKLSESITRVILAGQDLTKLAAYTQRVDHLRRAMRECGAMWQANNERAHHGAKTNRRLPAVACDDETRPLGLVKICDKDNPMIDFNNVTLSTPNSDILVKNLTFNIRPKQSVIIAGPNGSGKSSLFRVLGGLWPIQSGSLTRPASEQLFYICQKPYMTLGSLRDQIIFPDVVSRLTDQELVEILKIVELNYLLERDTHKLESVADWQDVLSGGEKQRMALARLIYHRPQFAILDECTSAVAIDVEQRIYRYLSDELNCTLLSVSHRVKQLAKFHDLILEFDGNGNFEFKRLVAAVS